MVASNARKPTKAGPARTMRHRAGLSTRSQNSRLPAGAGSKEIAAQIAERLIAHPEPVHLLSVSPKEDLHDFLFGGDSYTEPGGVFSSGTGHGKRWPVPQKAWLQHVS